MDNAHLVIYTFDLVGTAAFAFSGAIRALDRRPDFIGMLLLAGLTAIGGGMIRDAILGREAAVLSDPTYMWTILASVILIYFFPSSFWKRANLFNYFDAFGYGAFAGVAANIGVAQDMNLFAVLILATLTGCGGGVVRDVILGKPSQPLNDELYVIPVLCGASALYFLNQAQIPNLTASQIQVLGFLVAFLITTGGRLVAISWNIRLPRVDSEVKWNAK
ncbi:MAG: TRIC cation channel family protein [Planctomycetia bacterium]|nr:TRIC cation channel family protein [Planctomycetia bacterium]